jgi:ABC-type transport system involved in cytochrome c biogenesis permease subunit
MAPEMWGALAALLLAIAAVARGLALFRVRGRWELLAICARAGAAMALAVAVVLAAVTHGQWSPFDLWQVTLSLSLAILSVYVALAWRFRIDAAEPIVDLLALALILIGMLAIRPGGPFVPCLQQAWPFSVQWVLFLTGGGGSMVAGSAGLTLILARRGWPLHWPRPADSYLLLRQAAMLALVFLGGGLIVSMWWAWQAEGTLTSSDPREVWMAITCLIATMSLSVQHLQRRWERWAAGLAVLAATAVMVGFLAVIDLRRLLGM